MEKILEQVLVHVRATWRRKWWVLIFAWPIAIGGWYWQTTLPDQYQATAQVHVNTVSVLRPLLRGMSVTPDTDQRVRMMSRTLLTRGNMEAVARELDLDILGGGNASIDAIAGRLVNGVSLTSGRDDNIYTVRFVHEDPDVAQQVVQAVLDLFIEEGLGNSRIDLDSSERFIEIRIASYRERLEEKEREIEQFRRDHSELVSGGEGSHYERMQRVGERLATAQQELREAENRRETYARQVAGEEPNFLPEAGSGQQGDRELEARLTNLRQDLDDLRRRYTDNHPDVLQVRRMIDELEEERDLQPTIARERNGDQSSSVFYQQIRLALTESESQVAALRSRVEDLQEQYSRLESMLNEIPDIQSTFAALQRDQEVLRSNYEQLLDSRERASMSREVETGAEMVDFRVLEPPRRPTSPASPNRFALISGMLVMGVGAGTGFAFLLAQLRSTFHSLATISQVTGRPVLGSVSRVHTRSYARRRRLGLFFFVLFTGLLLAAYAGMLLGVHETLIRVVPRLLQAVSL